MNDDVDEALREAIVARALLEVFKELSTGSHDPRAGPRIRDSIYSQMIGCVMKGFSQDDERNFEVIITFLRRNPEAGRWAQEQLASPQGKRDFLALLRLALD